MNWKSRDFKQKSCLPYNSFFPHQRVQRRSISCHRCLRDQQRKKNEIKLRIAIWCLKGTAVPNASCKLTNPKHVQNWLGGWQLWAAVGSTKQTACSDGFLATALASFPKDPLSALSQLSAPFSPDSTPPLCNAKDSVTITGHKKKKKGNNNGMIYPLNQYLSGFPPLTMRIFVFVYLLKKKK